MRKDHETEYLTTGEVQKICRYKRPDTVRRLVREGILPGTRIAHNHVLIPAKAFWAWFHSKDVIPPKEPVLEESSHE